MKNVGLKSGSREICLSQSFEALNIRLKFRLKKNSSLAKLEFSEKLKGPNLDSGKIEGRKVYFFQRDN